MSSIYFCQDCDKYIKRRYKSKHIKAKSHQHMRDNIVINKHYIDDVIWCNLVEVIYDYMSAHRNKFEIFTTTIKCRIDEKNICIPINKISGYVSFFKYDDNPEQWLYLKNLNRHKLHIFVGYNGG